MLKRFLLFSLVLIAIYACSSSDENIEEINNNFDRGVMLKHIADNIIIPSYEDFSATMIALKISGDAFTSNPNQANLIDVRAKFVTAYIKWQSVEMFNIGRAEEINYGFFMNVFPLANANVENNISSGSYDLDNVNFQDEQGFPALDYLLYGVATTDTDILAKYISDANATNYKKYVLDILTQMDSKTQEVANSWTIYRNEFINSTANTATSALNKFLNDYIEYYERKLRANKFGTPAGIFSSGNPLPEKVEGLYSKILSKELALASLEAFSNLFVGKSRVGANANGISFKQYLEALDRADLSTAIINQLNNAKTEIEGLNDNFNQQIIDDNTKMTKAYDVLQKAVVFLKSDMASALNIGVIFADNDGD